MSKSSILLQRLIISGLCKPQEIKGCTKADIDRLEAGLTVKLPEAYVEIMLSIGRQAGTFLDDVTFFYPASIGLTDKSRKLLLESDVTLPDNIYVFTERYFEQIGFFYLDSGKADPPIYQWTDESPKKTRRVYKSIWQFIDEELSARE